jgi:beta-glucosidase
VKHLDSKVARPPKELKAFTRVHLAPQEEKIVKLSLPAWRLAYWSERDHTWVIEHDKIEITVGGSSTDARLTKTIQVDPYRNGALRISQ